ncbi:FMN-binding protein, partial [Streptomyces sp. S6]
MHPLRKRHPLRRVVLTSAATVSGVVLLLSLKPHTEPSITASGTAPLPATATGTATGRSIPTRYGPVQVRVTLNGGHITDVTVLAHPDSSPHDQRINAYALPQLTRETLT